MIDKNDGEWISVLDELPPEDGVYEIYVIPDSFGVEIDQCMKNLTGTSFYDGYGFVCGGRMDLYVEGAMYLLPIGGNILHGKRNMAKLFELHRVISRKIQHAEGEK